MGSETFEHRFVDGMGNLLPLEPGVIYRPTKTEVQVFQDSPGHNLFLFTHYVVEDRRVTE